MLPARYSRPGAAGAAAVIRTPALNTFPAAGYTITMAKTRIQEYAEKYPDQSIRFTPYALKKTGLVQSQVFLGIEDYMLICAPLQLSMTKGVFLVVLTPQEITFFQQFQKKLCTIHLTFQVTQGKKPLTLFIRASLDRVGPVKGRQNICMMEAVIKSCPNDMVEIIGEYIEAYNALKAQFQTFQEKKITVNAENARLMRYNNYSELIIGTAKTRCNLLSLSVTSLILRPSIEVPGLSVGDSCGARLYFQVYQFTVNGKVAWVDRTPDGQQMVTVIIDFAPELIEIVDDYYYRQSVEGRPANPR